jgi:hypothetical protein
MTDGGASNNMEIASSITLRRALPASLLAWTVACSGPAADPELGQSQHDIIGGFHASSPELDHTGALIAVDPLTDEPFAFCSSTLIGAQTVVTAKHCAVLYPQLELSGYGLFWGVGSDAQNPTQLIPVVAAESAPGDIGGFVGLGRDVAVLHLDRAPEGLTPATPRGLDASFEGEVLVSIGYGVHGASGAADDQRRVGRETVAATNGRVHELLFGTFESFVEWYFTAQVSDVDYIALLLEQDPAIQEFLDQLQDWFDAYVLLDRHEAVTGLGPADSQSCYGDSGGPLARPTADGWETYGVVSGGYFSLRMACDFGTVFSTFGPVTLPFLEAQRTWTDPCGEVDAAGVCEGEIARRCESSFTGAFRRLASEDCAALGQLCVSGENGVACGAEPPPPPEPTEPPFDVLAAVRASFAGPLSAQLPWTPQLSASSSAK